MRRDEFRNACYEVLKILEHVKEEDLSKIPQTLPDWSEERPIPDFGFSDGESMATPPNDMPKDFDPENFDPSKMGFPGDMGDGTPPINKAAENQSSRNITTNQDDFIENVDFPSSVEINLTG